MSTTQSYVAYAINGGMNGTTPGGTQFNGVIEVSITPGSDLTDAEAIAIQQAVLAAFPAAWGLTDEDVQIGKTDSSLILFTTDYTSNPPSFN